MARMAFAGAQAAMQGQRAAVELALVPTEEQTASRWSIDEEPMGPGWHDSSWMLKKGLDVIEGLPPGAAPPEWAWTWWLASFGGVQGHA
ncbi:MAG: hypothetical protein M9915_18570 [Rhizobacter sp.]|nr:hypothetical protein [Rhizobacter sp.]